MIAGAWAWLKGLPWFAAALKWAAVALGVLLVLLKVRQAGRDSVRREMAEEIVKRAEKANAAENEVRDAAARGKPPPERVRKFYLD